jgi:hypothetical protein
MTKPLLGLILGGTLGLMDGLSGFLEPSLAPIMGSVITFSMLKGLVSGIAIGYLAQKVRSMLWGILAGIAIAAVFSLTVWLHAGMKLFVDIVLPGMLLGAIVGFATQRWGKLGGATMAARAGEVSK